MATRLYLTSISPLYTPSISSVTELKGSWNTGATDSYALQTTKAGAAGAVDNPIGTLTADADFMGARWITGQFTIGGTIMGTVDWAIKFREDNGGLNGFSHIHIAVHQGLSNTLRGNLIVDNIGSKEFLINATGTAHEAMSSGVLSVNSVAVQAGDIIVAEVGWRANSTSTAYQGAYYRGGTGVDTTVGETSNGPATWMEFSDPDGIIASIDVNPKAGQFMPFFE